MTTMALFLLIVIWFGIGLFLWVTRHERGEDFDR